MLDDAGVRTAGTTYLIYRGRHEHEPSKATGAVPALAGDGAQARRSMGPRELFYADIFASRETPAAGRRSASPACATSTPAASAATCVEHDLCDFLLLSLPDNDTHSHRFGPDCAGRVDRRGRPRRSSAWRTPAGGIDAFLDDARA